MSQASKIKLTATQRNKLLSLAVGELWRRGQASAAIFDESQRQWLGIFHKHSTGAVGMVSRQRGKSFFAVTLACETAIKTPGAFIRYAAPTQKAVHAIVEPLIAQVLSDCPEGLRPRYSSQAGTWEWPNGSALFAAGVDNQQYDRLRGTRAHLVIFDEAAFYDDLEAVEAVLKPQLLTTGGKALYISSPPESPAHPFVSRYRAAQFEGNAFHATIREHPRLSEFQVREFLVREAKARGLSLDAFLLSTYCRREFFAEIVAEESRQAVPAWTPEKQGALIQERVRPKYFDAYVSLDIGFVDGHGALFAYWDIERSRLVIEDELVLKGKTIDVLAAAIKAKELALYGSTRFDGTLSAAVNWELVPEWLRGKAHSTAPRQPYLRIADDDPLALADLAINHGIAFLPTKKDEKALAVDAVNIAFQREEIEIHPRCEALQRQLYTTLWDKNRRQWERTSEGHGELIDCLVYLWRNLRKHKDPRPPQREVWDDFIGKPKGSDWDKVFNIRR